MPARLAPPRRAARPGRGGRWCAGAGLALLLAGPCATCAETVRQVLGDGGALEARWLPGRADRPAVLLVHGFLQTPESPTAHAIARRLAGEGMSVLAPTLSLGIHPRRAPLPCAAIHSHTLAGDVRELSAWVDWLVGQGHTRVVLAGHGLGGWQAVAYAAGRPSSALRSIIMISPPSAPAQAPQVLEALRARAGAGDLRLTSLAVFGCPDYTGPADALLSYASLDEQRLLEALRQVRVPVRALLGGRDVELDEAGRARLAGAGARVQLVPDARDFSASPHAAALLELLFAAVVIEG